MAAATFAPLWLRFFNQRLKSRAGKLPAIHVLAWRARSIGPPSTQLQYHPIDLSIHLFALHTILFCLEANHHHIYSERPKMRMCSLPLYHMLLSTLQLYTTTVDQNASLHNIFVSFQFRMIFDAIFTKLQTGCFVSASCFWSERRRVLQGLLVIHVCRQLDSYSELLQCPQWGSLCVFCLQIIFLTLDKTISPAHILESVKCPGFFAHPLIDDQSQDLRLRNFETYSSHSLEMVTRTVLYESGGHDLLMRSVKD